MTSETFTRLPDLIDTLDEDEAEDLLDYLLMKHEPATLSEDEERAFSKGIAEIERGEFVTRENLERKFVN